MANKSVANFVTTTPAKTVHFFAYEGPKHLRLTTVFRTIQQAGSIGAQNIRTDDVPLGFNVRVIGQGNIVNGSPVQEGIFISMVAQKGSLGTLTVRGTTYSKVRLLNVIFEGGRGGLRSTSSAGPVESQIEWQFDICTVQFSLEDNTS